jgi:hypothetical protein
MAHNIKAVQTETNSAPSTNKSELAMQLPMSVGSPAAAASLAIDQSHMEEFASAEEKSSDVRLGKPPKGNYFTVRVEDRAYYFILEMEGRDPYIVAPSIAKQKTDEDVIRPILVVRYITMAGEEGLWLLKLDRPDAKSNRFNTSALRILEEAEKGWVRLISAKGHYRYQVSKKTLEQTPARFSNRSFQELINIAFRDRVIDSLDHEIWDVLDQGSDK